MNPDPPDSNFPALPADVQLHACMTCAAAVPAKGIAIHDEWHRRIAASAINAHLRIDRLTGHEGLRAPQRDTEVRA